MYIRRKVFSVAYDETTGEEKLFSTTEIISEEAYMEKLYAEAEEEKSRGKGAAIGAGIAAGTVGTGAAGLYGAGKLGKHLQKKRVMEKLDKRSTVNSLKNDEFLQKLREKEGKYGKNSQRLAKAEEELSEAMKKKAGKVEKYAVKAGKLLKNNKKLAIGAGAGAGAVAIGAGAGAAKGKK